MMLFLECVPIINWHMTILASIFACFPVPESFIFSYYFQLLSSILQFQHEVLLAFLVGQVWWQQIPSAGIYLGMSKTPSASIYLGMP